MNDNIVEKTLEERVAELERLIALQSKYIRETGLSFARELGALRHEYAILSERVTKYEQMQQVALKRFKSE